MNNYYPTKEEFVKLSKRGNLIPVYRELLADMETPVSAFLKIGTGKYSYLLESVEGGERIGRYSFMGSEPSVIFKSVGKDITLIEDGKIARSNVKHDPLSELKNILSRYKFVAVKGLPRFSGGFVGYISYDAVRFFEEIPDKNQDELKLPDFVFMLTDTILIFDHLNHKLQVVSNARVEGDPAKAYDEAVSKIEAAVSRLNAQLKTKPQAKSHAPAPKPSPTKPVVNFTRDSFRKAVLKAKEYIRAGEIIQVVLSQRFTRQFSCKTFDLYRALRSINPSPYMYYLKLGDFNLIGSSPEVFVRCEDGEVQLRPIAGTRPRGKDAAEDAALEKSLLSDPKELSEHIMLVDLGRNDIGRVCETGTVRVTELKALERYSHVMHIVSDVEGRLRKNSSIFDLVKATFPAGTVTGAPKIRAMEIIDELENIKRGPYAGAVGYFSFSGNLDTCITIRTIIAKDNKAYIQAGAGIVAESDPSREYDETLNKAKAMLKALDAAEAGF